MKKVKLRKARNPYVVEMRHKRSGAFKDREKVTDYMGGIVKVPILHLEYGLSRPFCVREDLLMDYSSVDPDGIVNVACGDTQE